MQRDQRRQLESGETSRAYRSGAASGALVVAGRTVCAVERVQSWNLAHCNVRDTAFDANRVVLFRRIRALRYIHHYTRTCTDKCKQRLQNHRATDNEKNYEMRTETVAFKHVVLAIDAHGGPGAPATTRATLGRAIVVLVSFRIV